MAGNASRWCVLCLLLCFVGAHARADGNGDVNIGDVAPDTLGTSVAREDVLLSTGAGRVTVVTFWASWCSPCLKELPMLEALARLSDHRGLGLRVIAVNIEDRRTFSRLARKLAEYRLTLANDVRGAAQRAYGVKGIPHLVLVGRDGRILKVFQGYSEEQLERVIAEINAALGTPDSAPQPVLDTRRADPEPRHDVPAA